MDLHFSSGTSDEAGLPENRRFMNKALQVLPIVEATVFDLTH